jgi:hypothetical protein
VYQIGVLRNKILSHFKEHKKRAESSSPDFEFQTSVEDFIFSEEDKLAEIIS